jgi:hypothetical protein
MYTGMTDAPATHPTEKGAEEQASSVKPEGNNSTTQEERAHSTASNGMFLLKRFCFAIC